MSQISLVFRRNTPDSTPAVNFADSALLPNPFHLMFRRLLTSTAFPARFCRPWAVAGLPVLLGMIYLNGSLPLRAEPAEPRDPAPTAPTEPAPTTPAELPDAAVPEEPEEPSPEPSKPVAPPETKPNQTIADLKLELLWIKSGTFTMGSPPDEANRHRAEGPAFEVTFTKGFWLGKTEVTQAQYEGLLGTNPSRLVEAGKTAPVEQVSWIDAVAWCEKLTERERAAKRLPEGYVYTLPTEAQWEYAYRAGTTEAFPGDAEAMTWHDQNSRETTHPVAQKEANAWGLYDMGGNVLEWCLDWYGDYPRGPQTDPKGPDFGHFRMARGGSWRLPLPVARAAARSGGSPGRRDYTIGFRLALSAQP
jgi:formylglycine-generating enzyme required for sulfatase activity